MKYLINDKHYTDDELNLMSEIVVDGFFDLSGFGFKELPEWVSKCIVYGDFDCSENQLINLKNSPKRVYGNFWCEFNKLTSLSGFNQNSMIVFFDCSGNQLTSIKDGPKIVFKDFYCRKNKIDTYFYLPVIKGNFICDLKPLLKTVTLRQAPRYIRNEIAVVKI